MVGRHGGGRCASHLPYRSKVAPRAAWDISTPVTINDGQLNISLSSVKENTKISAIKITKS